MPFYKYRCEKCDEEVELLRKIKARDEETRCPVCDGIADRQLTVPKLLAETSGLKTPYDYLDGPIPNARKIQVGWGRSGERLPFNKRKPDTEPAK